LVSKSLSVIVVIGIIAISFFGLLYFISNSTPQAKHSENIFNDLITVPKGRDTFAQFSTPSGVTNIIFEVSFTVEEMKEGELGVYLFDQKGYKNYRNHIEFSPLYVPGASPRSWTIRESFFHHNFSFDLNANTTYFLMISGSESLISSKEIHTEINLAYSSDSDVSFVPACVVDLARYYC